MRANYLQRNKPRYPYFSKVLWLALVFIVAALLLSVFDKYIVSAAAPIWRMDNVLTRSLKASVGLLQSKKSLINENAELKERVTMLENELLTTAANKSQEASLLELLNRKPNENSIAATVLIHPPQTPYDVIIVDAGGQNAVGVGYKVALPEGEVIGSVQEVYERSSRVRLLSHDGERTNAVLERHNVPVVLEGIGAGNFRIELPRDAEVAVGDRILSADISASLVAVVQEVGLEPTDSHKEVLAQSPVNIFNLRFVFLTP